MTKIIEFPTAITHLAALRQAYQSELERYEHAEYAGKRPRFNQRIRKAYFAACISIPIGFSGAPIAALEAEPTQAFSDEGVIKG